MAAAPDALAPAPALPELAPEPDGALAAPELPLAAFSLSPWPYASGAAKAAATDNASKVLSFIPVSCS